MAKIWIVIEPIDSNDFADYGDEAVKIRGAFKDEELAKLAAGGHASVHEVELDARMLIDGGA
jgi:hypothetical protein